MSADHSNRPPQAPYRGFESEPSDEWREDYGRGGPVRSNEPERDWFFERNAAPESVTATRSESRAPRNSRGDERAPIAHATTSFRGQGPKGYRPRDERLYEIICERLTEHRAIDARELSVAVDEGVVTVRGTVPNRAMKRILEDVIAEVHGVGQIRNEVKAEADSRSG